MPRLERETAGATKGEKAQMVTAPAVPDLGEAPDGDVHAATVAAQRAVPRRTPAAAVTAPAKKSATDEALGLDEAEEIALPQPEPEQDLLAEFSIQARVVYLGNNRAFAQYFPGTAEPYEDDSAGRHTTKYRATPHGATTYNFNRYDATRRLNTARLTRDGKPFAICRHIGHLALFQAMRDADGMPIFEIRAMPGVFEQIDTYLTKLRQMRARDQDSGTAVLKAMGIA